MGHGRFRWIDSHHHVSITTTIVMIFSSLFLKIPDVHASSSTNVNPSSQPYDFESLSTLIRSSTMATLRSQRTGVLSQVPLPSNYSSVRASAIRLSSGNMFDLGSAASTLFLFPPGLRPYPFSRRITFIFFDLGAVLSPRYFQVPPGYSLVAPVIGFSAYDAAKNFADPAVQSLIFTSAVGSILVRFPHLNTTINSTTTARCVKFTKGGLVQLRNITDDLICETEGGGQFTVVVKNKEEDDKVVVVVRRAIVIAAAATVGAICLLVILVTSYKMARRSNNRIGKMEGEAENGVPFYTTWIGRTKMPSASMVRTQPTLEHGYIP